MEVDLDTAFGSPAHLDDLLGAPEHWTSEQGRALWLVDDPSTVRVAAMVSGSPVGYGVSTRSTWHPQRRWVFVEVRPEFRREGIGSRILASVRHQLPSSIRLRCKAHVMSPGFAFAAHHGFAPLMGTQTIEVERQQMHDLDPVRKVPHAEIDHAIVDAWRRYYVAGHVWDPVGDPSEEAWAASMGDDTTILIWPTSGQPEAIAIVGPDGDWTGGTVDRDHPASQRAVRSLLSGGFDEHDRLQIEFDDWMTEVAEVLRPMPKHVADHSAILAES